MTSQTFVLPTIGQVWIDKVLLSYDGPRIFLIRTVAGERYFSYWAADLDVADRWWFFPVSEARIEQIELGRLSIRDAIVNAESGYVFETEWADNALSPSMHRYLAVADLLPESLPREDSYLQLGNAPAAPVATNVPAYITATQHRRLVLRVRILTRSHEALVTRVASVLATLQGTLDAFGQALSGKPSERGMIPQLILDQTALSLSSVFPGSVGFELIGEHLEVLPSELLTRSISTLDAVLGQGGDLNALRGYFADLHKRSVTRFKNFLESIVDVESDVELSWGSPNQDADRHRVLRQTDIAQYLESLYREELQATETSVVVGELVGVNKRTRRFELRELGTDRKVSGRILQSAMDATRRATLSAIYNATVVRTEEYQPLTDGESVRYELLGLQEHGPALRA